MRRASSTSTATGATTGCTPSRQRSAPAGCSAGCSNPSSHTSCRATHLWTSAPPCASKPRLALVDLSGLIFVALALAWAAYLIPKALKHHEDVVRSRSVDRFSDRMRVLARREPVDRRNARLVVTPGRPAVQVESVTQGEEVVTTAAQLSARRAATNSAARRRRRVLLMLLLANVAVVALGTARVINAWWVAAPAAVLIAWLVACRLMVRRERTWKPSVVEQVVDALIEETVERPAVALDEADTDTFAAVEADPDLWDPVPVTLPTYVGKAAAQRTVRTIDLDATGVWTSGRNEADSRLARDAEEA